MKKIINNLAYIFVATLCIGSVSCTDYLDKAPQSTITIDEAFKNWESAQGFVEELYAGIPDPQKVSWWGEWNYADEFIATTASEGLQLCAQFDLGNYWSALGISSDDQGRSWFYRSSANMGTGSARNKNVWSNAWYIIRKSNLGLENLDRFVGTQEETNALKGQMLFARALAHFAIIEFWGGMPYIDRTLSSNEKLDFPRLTYQETAARAAEDFEAAAKLLPADWDESPVGQTTLGKNPQRITSALCYAYLGKNLLFAASPLMNESSTGKTGYDTELCKKAADAFAKVLKMVDSGESIFNLNETFEGDAGYKHLFCTYDKLIPGEGTPKNGKEKFEIMFAAPTYNFNENRWSAARMYAHTSMDGEQVCAPTHNYVQNFGMANGRPLSDPKSGYDPSHPWKDRDPRFYTDVIYDGRQLVVNKDADPATKNVAYANLYTGGSYRGSGLSRTGYYNGKWIRILGGANRVDNQWGNLCMRPAFMRLADVYLMYAEAVLWGYGSPTAKDPNYTMTALDAVNKIKNRAGLPNMAPEYTSTNEAFWKELIRERAVELAFEGQRWVDLRRWKISGEKEYLAKTGIDFDRVSQDGTADNKNGEIANVNEFVIINRVFENKHYWLPLPTDQVNLYEGFSQNPGW